MANGVKLFLDDVRLPADCYSYMHMRTPYHSIYLEPDWQIVRSHEEFINWIETNGIPYMVSFDHDLADAHYAEWLDTSDDDRQAIVTEGTGLDSAKWLKELCEQTNQMFPSTFVHSMNPIGTSRIWSVVNSVENRWHFNGKENV